MHEISKYFLSTENQEQCLYKQPGGAHRPVTGRLSSTWVPVLLAFYEEWFARKKSKFAYLARYIAETARLVHDSQK